MENKDRDKIRNNMVLLTGRLKIYGQMLNYLYEKRILSQQMVEEIESKKTNTEKNRHLLQLIPRRGEDALPRLIECLIKSGQKDLAYIIDPVLCENTLSDNLCCAIAIKHENDMEILASLQYNNTNKIIIEKKSLGKYYITFCENLNGCIKEILKLDEEIVLKMLQIAHLLEKCSYDIQNDRIHCIKISLTSNVHLNFSAVKGDVNIMHDCSMSDFKNVIISLDQFDSIFKFILRNDKFFI